MTKPDSVRLPPEINAPIVALDQQKNVLTQRQLDILGAYWIGIGAGRFNPDEWDFKDGVGTRIAKPTEQEVSEANGGEGPSVAETVPTPIQPPRRVRRHPEKAPQP